MEGAIGVGIDVGEEIVLMWFYCLPIFIIEHGGGLVLGLAHECYLN
jgi:hypothetical protein